MQFICVHVQIDFVDKLNICSSSKPQACLRFHVYTNAITRVRIIFTQLGKYIFIREEDTLSGTNYLHV